MLCGYREVESPVRTNCCVRGFGDALVLGSGLAGGKTQAASVENRGVLLSGVSPCSILEYGLLESGEMHCGQSSDLLLF